VGHIFRIERTPPSPFSLAPHGDSSGRRGSFHARVGWVAAVWVWQEIYFSGATGTVPPVNEIAPGLWHWKALRESIGSEVSSYYLMNERVLIDPMIPPQGLGWFEDRGRPDHLLLTNRHHDRDAWELREAFGCAVHCIREGLHELEGRGPVEAFDFEDALPGGVVAYEVDAICPDECALHVPAHRALACADGVVRWPDDGPLTFVRDEFMDDPERTKKGLRDAYRRLLDLDFDRLLLAHGDPIGGGAKDELFAFVERA
jgi:hypothetical protein